MDCLMLPVACWGRGGPGYEVLSDSEDEMERMITVVAGKEKREFLVDPFVLKANPFRSLLDHSTGKIDRRKGVVFVDVDAILFEHLLWLMHNDLSSLFKLNLKEVIEFYSQDS
uniref:Uncharacterized protein n=1 Tax=Kalanchoe fedtschenkoi TaxID=63787 RepID=A0A7N0ZT32_KALFE